MRQTWPALIAVLLIGVSASAAEPAPDLVHDVLPLVKVHCVKCHGPAKAEGSLNLSTPGFLAHGGDSGRAIEPGDIEASVLWQRVAADEMPPDQPLGDDDKQLLRRWIEAGAPGLPEQGSAHPSGGHWAFVPLTRPAVPSIANEDRAANEIDRFLLAELEPQGLSFAPEADRRTLIRRVAFDLTGLPPTPEEIEQFLGDSDPEAYLRMVDRYLASPRYGERWGKFWLDAAGYADSNGHFNADSDRPLAYRYRDYVVRAVNADKPFDRFVVEQLAGDELAGFRPGEPTTPEVISLLEATHYLRNSQDGTGESDGNPDEIKNDRYAALDGCLQIVSTSLLGLTVQCAKCHDHKFEPLSQRDYYNWQSVFYPAFNVENWAKPNERVVQATLPGELEAWQGHEKEIDETIAMLRQEFSDWARDHQPHGRELFRDEFAADGPPLADRWSATAPGDQLPAGPSAVNLNSDVAPAARLAEDNLRIIDGTDGGERVISTRESFDWSPEEPGAWIQATFDLVELTLDEAGQPPERAAYYIALANFNAEGAPLAGGNVLLEGNPAGGVGTYLDYPGPQADDKGYLGVSKYEPGRNYGVRVTRLPDGQCQITHLVDGIPEEKPMTVPADELPEGGFGFGYACGRSFVVDNLVIKASIPENLSSDQQLAAELQSRREALSSAVDEANQRRRPEPGKIAWMTDRSPTPPEVHLLERGSHKTPGEAVSPAPLSALADDRDRWDVHSPESGAETTGWRLAWARWVTDPRTRAGALLARVQANRIWQHHFGTGIVATSDNLGVSGSPPTHPELLEYLASEFVERGWSRKALHRMILASAAYTQSSAASDAALRADPDNKLLARFRVRRLDAEAIRDATLSAAGVLDEQMGGRYVPTTRDGAGEVVVVPGASGANRRSLYLQQRRTQTLSLLGVFDAPTIVVNCVERPVSTVPLQSLSLLNSPFMIDCARQFAERIEREAGEDADARLQRAFLIAWGRAGTNKERAAATEFLDAQHAIYADQEDAGQRTWTDFCQMLLASSAFLYVE